MYVYVYNVCMYVCMYICMYVQLSHDQSCYFLGLHTELICFFLSCLPASNEIGCLPGPAPCCPNDPNGKSQLLHIPSNGIASIN